MEANSRPRRLLSEKWWKYQLSSQKDALVEFQQCWYVELYGFESEDAPRRFLAGRTTVLADRVWARLRRRMARPIDA